MKPENRSTPDGQRKTGGQLNERSLDILYNASKRFLAVEVGRIDADNTTREAKEMIISKATKLYFEKITRINKTIKNEN
ncbi:MAG: hypothetical protein JSS94_05815 [Bacteroidetes bacterium]|nr:hypothetical protein [Bacteroidota bacterium]